MDIVLTGVTKRYRRLTVLQDVEGILGLVVRGALVSGLLFLIFSLYEFRPPQKWKSLVVILLWLAIWSGIGSGKASSSSENAVCPGSPIASASCAKAFACVEPSPIKSNSRQWANQVLPSR